MHVADKALGSSKIAAWKATVASIAIVSAASWFSGCAHRNRSAFCSHAGNELPDTIAVQGLGQASAAPDLAKVTLGVEARGKEVSQVLAAVNGRMKSVVGALKAAGVAGKDLQTRDLSLHLEHPQTPRELESGGTSPVPSFYAQSLVEASVRNLDRLGETLAAGLQAGANHLASLQFSLEASQALEAQARRRAMADARSKAEQLAKAAGMRLGRVRSVSEQHGGSPMPAGRGFRLESAMADAAPPVERGSQTVSIAVQVIFELR